MISSVWRELCHHWWTQKPISDLTNVNLLSIMIIMMLLLLYRRIIIMRSLQPLYISILLLVLMTPCSGLLLLLSLFFHINLKLLLILPAHFGCHKAPHFVLLDTVLDPRLYLLKIFGSWIRVAGVFWVIRLRWVMVAEMEVLVLLDLTMRTVWRMPWRLWWGGTWNRDSISSLSRRSVIQNYRSLS